ncbi:DUF389 domain-containing protein [Kineosporia sp. J2-2]|uniref:DUF389 domain-containing protein n=1 Tax=Kineosporia corallincola TaxID=2835133 RepID=A0ABS5TS86_9ACTN|nr:DUF389 domain-containing protein [Kineosporia corallincola]MBT0773650.1 DUF389 domain-containing protein [Kineosporia corallincola]
MIHLRLVLPGGASKDVIDYLCRDSRVFNVAVLPGAVQDPPGDMVLCDVAREAVSDVDATLQTLGVDRNATVAMQDIDTIRSDAAEAAERAAPGSPDDGIVWERVVGQARSDARGSWAFHTFLILATLIAAVAVLTDSSVLVVGAMVVGPEFGPVSAVAVGLVLGLRPVVVGAVRLLVLGFLLAITVTTLAALAGRAAGWVTAADVAADRPFTGFIWTPDRWSFVVALLAGAAGVLSLTAGRSNALVGVFISVTTVPAAGNLALALAVWVPDEIGGAAAQLGVNLAGMVLAGCLVLGVQRVLTGLNRGAVRAEQRRS